MNQDNIYKKEIFLPNLSVTSVLLQCINTQDEEYLKMKLDWEWVLNDLTSKAYSDSAHNVCL